ncbi:MAG: hypothetical protein PHQ75_00835 [Thermoguttaceae bacterium]|nr:hypothetical protein [Thermoguttaceae bacterium]
MGDKLVNSFIASIIGCMSAAITVWFLSDSKSSEPVVPACAVTCPVNNQGNSGHMTSLVVDHLQVNDRLVVVDQRTGKPMIEFKDGNAYVQNGIYTRQLGSMEIVSQKVQITPDNPIQPQHTVFAELAINRQGSPYFALLSSQKTHSINFGFDTTETGYIISQNNRQPAVVPQAILPIPKPQDANSQVPPTESIASGHSNSLEYH